MNETEFSKKFPVGTPVNYHPIIGQPEFRPVSIRSEPWLLGSGHMVVKVTGVSGGVSCAAIEAVEQPNAVDKCPSCGGSGKEVLAFLHGAKCIDCDGTGICH